MARVKIIERPNVGKINRKLDLATAAGTTKTLHGARAASLSAINKNFTIRTNWADASIKVLPATADRPTGEISTSATFLDIHDKGGVKRPTRSRRFAVPTENVRRGGKIPASRRPSALRGKKSFVLKTSKGPVIFERKGKKLVALYGLEKSVRIRKRPVFREPVETFVRRNLSKNVAESIGRAMG